MSEESPRENADVVIKSEFHSSTADQVEALELLRGGEFNAVVFENARENVEEITTPTLTDRIIGLPFFFLSPLYTDNTPLLAAAFRNGTDPYYTRETNGDIIRDLPAPLQTAVVSGWILFIAFTLFFAAPQGVAFSVVGQDVKYSMLSLFSFLGAFTVPIAVRSMRGVFGNTVNRNQLMANRIRDAHSEAGRTLAIVGRSHSERVEKRLPSNIEAYVIPTKHGLLTARGLLYTLSGVIQVLVLFVAVWAVIERIGGAIVLFVLVVLLS